MLALSSHTQQWENRKSEVQQNIKFILSHFKEPIFPRIITSRSTTGDETQFKVVYNEEEMLRTYEESKFIDRRVSIYRVS
jgi:ribosomal protein S24E